MKWDSASPPHLSFSIPAQQLSLGRVRATHILLNLALDHYVKAALEFVVQINQVSLAEHPLHGKACQSSSGS